jgi:hypothetical protein
MEVANSSGMNRNPKLGYLRPYEPNKRKVSQLFFAGFLATLTMMLLDYLAPHVGIPAPDFASLYGTLFNDNVVPDRFGTAWWIGLMWHLATTILILPLLEDYLTDRLVLPSQRWMKGGLWGASLWFLIEALIKPVAGWGFFSNRMPNPALQCLLSLVSWVVYGLVFDGAAREVRFAHELHIGERNAA